MTIKCHRPAGATWDSLASPRLPESNWSISPCPLAPSTVAGAVRAGTSYGSRARRQLCTGRCNFAAAPKSRRARGIARRRRGQRGLALATPMLNSQWWTGSPFQTVRANYRSLSRFGMLDEHSILQIRIVAPATDSLPAIVFNPDKFNPPVIRQVSTLKIPNPFYDRIAKGLLHVTSRLYVLFFQPKLIIPIHNYISFLVTSRLQNMVSVTLTVHAIGNHEQQHLTTVGLPQNSLTATNSLLMLSKRPLSSRPCTAS